MPPLARFRISPLKTIHVNWSHVFAFLLSAAGIVIAALQQQLSTKSAVTWTALGLAVAGPIWQLFLQSIVQTNLPPSAFSADTGVPMSTVPNSELKNTRDSMKLGLLGVQCALLLGGLAMILIVSACQTLPAVVQDVANIAAIVLADAEKVPPMEPAAIVADVIAQTGIQDLNLIAQIIESVAADSKTPASAVATLHAASAQARTMALAKGDAS
jgi:hypothetical protein